MIKWVILVILIVSSIIFKIKRESMPLRNNLLSNIFKPYTIIPKISLIFFFWLIFVVLFSMGGILASFPYYDLDKTHIFIWLNNMFNTGSLYSISIALSASLLFLVFVEPIKEEEDTKFRNLKLGAAGISILMIFIMAFAYSCLLNKKSNHLNTGDFEYYTDWLQTICYIVSLLLNLYILCVSCLGLDYDNFQAIDDKKRIELKNGSENLTKDGTTGAKL